MNLFYTNRSSITKTFHGVTFRPGETKEVSGIINDSTFVHSSMRQEPPKRVRRTRTKSENKDAIKNSQDSVQFSDLVTTENIENKEV